MHFNFGCKSKLCSQYTVLTLLIWYVSKIHYVDINL